VNGLVCGVDELGIQELPTGSILQNVLQSLNVRKKKWPMLPIPAITTLNSHTDFYNAIEHSNVDTSMVARGAIVKPWIFEEISLRQHLDKSATERLDMLRQFAYWGLEHWVPFQSCATNTRGRTYLELLLLAGSSVSL
jgi:tRNA-dihydrouridine synthase